MWDYYIRVTQWQQAQILKNNWGQGVSGEWWPEIGGLKMEVVSNDIISGNSMRVSGWDIVEHGFIGGEESRAKIWVARVLKH